MLPPKPDDVRDLLRNVTEAAAGVDLRDLPLLQEHPWIEEVAPQLFTATTQGFVDFGNLVTSAFPELLTLIAEVKAEAPEADIDPPEGAAADPTATESETKVAISALVEALRADAEAQLDTVEAAASTLRAHASEAEEANARALAQTLAATDEVIACWTQISEELAGLETRLSNPEEIDVAALRAVPAAWQRIVGAALQVQAAQEPQLPGAPNLKIVPENEP